MPIIFEVDDEEYEIRQAANGRYTVYRMAAEQEIVLGGFITESLDEEILRDEAELVISETR